MPKRTKPLPAYVKPYVKIGGQMLPVLQAALMAVAADRRKVIPRKILAVTMPTLAPTQVIIARQRVSVETAALLAEVADSRGILLKALITEVLQDHASRLDRRASPRETHKKPAKGKSPHREG